MRQAIVTKYNGPTDFSGSKITARCQGGSAREPWDHALNAEDNHLAAAQKLVAKMGWFPPVAPGDTLPKWTWIGGALPDGKSYAWVDREG